MKLNNKWLNREFTDPDSTNSGNLAYDETRSITNELQSISGDNTTITVQNSIKVDSCGTPSCNGLYIYAGVIGGKPYYVFEDYRIIWSASNTRWELQQSSPVLIMYYNNTTDDLSKPYYDSNWTVDNGVAPIPNFVESDRIIKKTEESDLKKKPVRLLEISTNLSLTGAATIDGSAVVDGDRIAVFNQTTGSENGFYIANTSGAWTRTLDFPSGYNASGSNFLVLEGVASINSVHEINNIMGSDIVGVDVLTITQLASLSNIHWQQTGIDRLEPINSSIEGIELSTTHNGYTWLTLQNTDNTGNSAGAVFELHTSNTAYQDNAYFGLYGNGFWLPFLAGNAAFLTDRNLVIGTVDAGNEIRFVVGNAYTNPVQVGMLDADGLSLTSLQSSSVHPTSHLNVMVNTATGLMYASTTGNTTIYAVTDTFTITALDIANGYLSLSQTPLVMYHNSVNMNGLILIDGDDYVLNPSPNRVTFTASQIANLTIGDRVQAKYNRI